MDNKIVIMGAGAVGSYLGAFLTTDQDVTLIDMWPENVLTMRDKGLRASGSQGDFTVPVKAAHITEAQSIKESFDIAILAVKSYDTEWACHFIKRFLKPSGVVVSAQNCLNDEIVASIVGYDKTIGCVMSHIEVALWEPAHVIRGGAIGRDSGHDVFRVGTLRGKITPRVEQLVSMLSVIDGARPTTNLLGERWTKLTQNCMGNAVGAMSTLGSQSVAKDSNARALRIHLARETVRVGQALNFQLEPIAGFEPTVWAKSDQQDTFRILDEYLQSHGGRVDWLASMAQDVKKGRLTEIGYMNGLVVDHGKEVNIPTPVSKAIVSIVKEIDANRLDPDPKNIDKVMGLVGC